MCYRKQICVALGSLIMLGGCQSNTIQDETLQEVSTSMTSVTTVETDGMTETSIETTAVNVSNIEIVTDDIDVAIYAKALVNIVADHGGYGMGIDCGLYDVDADGTYEIAIRDGGMGTNLRVYNIDGIEIWRNAACAFDASDEFKTEYVSNDTDNTIIFYGITNNIYTVEPMNGTMRMCAFVSEDITAKIYDFANADLTMDFINADDYAVVEVSGKDATEELYREYFGEWSVLETSDILNVHKVQFTDDLNAGLYVGNIAEYSSELESVIQDALK